MIEKTPSSPDKSIQSDQAMVRWLSVSYFGALAVVATLAVIAHILLSNVIQQQSDSATVINLAGRQRMLSQRIGFLVEQLRNGDETARGPLKEAAKLMDRSESAIVHGGDLGIRNQLSSDTYAYYFKGAKPLDEQVTAFVAAANQVAATPSKALDPEALNTIRTRTRTGLLPALDHAVTMFETESKSRTGWLENVQRVVTFILLVTLVLEAAFIYRPIVRKVREFASRLYQLATRDALTGLPNRRFFLESANRHVGLISRTNHPVAVVMLDVDHFKRINDTFGHASGDAALRRLARLIENSIRGTDFAGRLGGEEFGVFLPNTDAEAAAVIAERLRLEVQDDEVTDAPRFTVSMGIASSVSGDGTIDGLLAQADAALYKAKSDGRNRVILAPSAASA